MIAMTILTGAIIVISNTWSGNLLRVRKSNLFNNISFLLERKVNEIDALYKNKPIAEIPTEEGGEFEDFPKYTWKMESQEFEMPDISAALISKDGGADEMLLTMIKTVTEFISKAVVEVKITVAVKVGKRSVKYSVTTYFVDYDQELSIGGLGGG